ncbi:MAG: hypothetical protein H8E41_10145 [Desulfobulbaceae bacterium]|uniref:Uncharacterized protein n=1 Tax=Candidatus Desulfobia pelagia TaxID=2841692 RepID=A0A8J6NEY0_9BACT|nr:hypothetical protein [Candidatus Desulfobia pelagia]
MEHTLNKTTANVNEIHEEIAGEGVAQAGIIIILTLAGLIGIWGINCMVGAAAYCGGPGALIRGFITAVTGM